MTTLRFVLVIVALVVALFGVKGIARLYLCKTDPVRCADQGFKLPASVWGPR